MRSVYGKHLRVPGTTAINCCPGPLCWLKLHCVSQQVSTVCTQWFLVSQRIPLVSEVKVRSHEYVFILFLIIMITTFSDLLTSLPCLWRTDAIFGSFASFPSHCFLSFCFYALENGLEVSPLNSAVSQFCVSKVTGLVVQNR